MSENDLKLQEEANRIFNCDRDILGYMIERQGDVDHAPKTENIVIKKIKLCFK